MVDIARFRQANDGMNQYIGLPCAGCSDSQFAVSAVHGVPCLEGDHSGPAKLIEMGSEFSRRVAKSYVVIVVQSGHGLHFSTDVILLGSVEKVFDRWVILVAAKHLLGLPLSMFC